MAGEINFGILDPKLGASFATGYNEAENRRNELAAQVQQRALGEQQLQQAMSQNELSKYTLSSAKRSDAQREALDAYVNNPSFNPKDPAQLQRLMGFGEAGRGMLKAVMDQEQVRGTIAKTKGEVNAQDLKAARDRHEALAGALGPLAAAIQAGKPVTHNDVFGAAQQLLGSNVISQKDLASIPMRSEDLPNYIMALVASNENSRNAFKMYLSKPEIAGGQIVEMNPLLKVGSRIADVSPVASPFSGLLNERAALPLGDPRFADYNRKISKESTSAPSVQVNVGNEKRYGEQFASKVAEGDVVLRAAAQEAPVAAENANRILQTLATGKAIVGAGADIKLGIAKLLNIAGADNAEIISNTEGMVTSMAQNTLNAIKTSGLGTGQGFTDKDLKFLEAAKSGNINFQPDTIRRLAELSHKAAEATADKWNSRAREIPASAIQGTGVSLEPVRVPKRASSVTEGVRPSGVGANWTLLVDANGSKAWVSPDRKQIKEVQ